MPVPGQIGPISSLGATPCRCLEERLEIRGPNPFGTCAEALFSIAAYFK